MTFSYDKKPYSDMLTSEEVYWKENVFLGELINQIPAAIFWKDKQSVFLGCNKLFAKLAALDSPQDIIGKTDYDLPWSEAESTAYREDDQFVIKSQKAKLGIEERQTLANGQEIVLLTSKIPLFINQQVIGLLGIYFDISERKKMEDDLRIAKEVAESANRAKTEFIANMGHDIRTPLTGIIGFSRYLEEEIVDIEQKDCARQIHESGEQLLSLLNGVLDMITTDSTHEDSLVSEAFDLRQMLRDVSELERPAIVDRNLALRVIVDAAVPQTVIGDRMKLHRIFLNLVGNAIKFTDNGFVELGIRLLENNGRIAHIEFSVKDTGIGIPEAMQDKVFDRFFKVTPSYKGTYNGNGIGLHIVQKYVELMQGKMSLSSQVGLGTTISFVIPMQIAEASSLQDERLSQASMQLSPDTQVRSTQLESMPRVLLVEDNLAAMKILRIMVQKYGVQVSGATDAETAFELFQTQSFDLIITDLGLPGKQGDELTAMIRAFEIQQGRIPVPVIGLTGHALGEITELCLQAGMNKVYRKPISPQALNSLIEPLIYRYKKSQVQGSLGIDLPNTEAELFEIAHYPLFDLNLAIHLLGSEAMVRDIFKSLKMEGIDEDLALIKMAHQQSDWKTIEKLAHKIKGGAVYGTVRMHYALLYMERYQKSGHTKCSEALYIQMLEVIDETMNYIDTWLSA